ncbi:carbon-nitrogen hydrolase family protein [Jeongeupia naejangsanensis]|uniref:Carbon-nitrogen hydrolase family protein n=1 Tax=Jeongeupia naejangsanensis TaxID=613195 RepID=A0ABS2BKX5_9NEIS|nr:carbon-nitrogen hydrolase family protein [Jeongeupia naejangsanensis]MBM3116261.1 carbon-nitrogen hydrolase family protein [Jeongeupia naejangsanensis]
MKTLTATAIQMVSTPDVADNLRTAAGLIERAAGAGATLAVLPEYFAIMGQRDTDKLAVAEAFGRGLIQDFLAAQADRHGLWLVGGTVPLAAPGATRVRNASLVFDSTGICVGRYDKIHLFGFDNGSEHYAEADTIEAGNTPLVLDTPFGRLGVAVCYDLRFPELFRTAGEVDIWALPAAFTATTGRAHWEVLLRARAIENQCFVVASAQGGVHQSGRETWGHSMIVDPWGQVLALHEAGPGLASAELKASQLERVRKVLPALAHRRL